MLKITYIENGFYLEYLSESVATWMARRALVYLRAAISIYTEPSTACIIIPHDLAISGLLEKLQADGEIIELTFCDEGYVEVSLLGTWVSSNQDSEEGIFVCDLSDRAETFLYKLWQKSQTGASVMSE
ncbi:MAG: alr0857 family protein [Pleurocapsa sp.]